MFENQAMQDDLQRLADGGIFLAAGGMRPLLANNKHQFSQMALDADPFNPTSNGVPSIYTTIYVNTIIDQLLPQRGYFEIASPMQQGEWTTERAEFPVRAISGGMSPYDDFSNQGQSGVNFTWVPRDIYRAETTIQYGDLETAVMDSAKLDLVGSKRAAIAQNIAIMFNRMGFFGNVNTAGQFISKTYGLLNDPSLNPSFPVVNGAAGSPLWSKKEPQEIYNDIVTAMAAMEDQTGNQVHPDDRYLLCLDGASNIQLNRANQYGTTALKLLKENFKNLEVVVAPEYKTILGFQLIVESIAGQKVVHDLFTYKYRSHGVMRYDSWFNEKVSCGSGGAAITLPAGIVTCTGIE